MKLWVTLSESCLWVDRCRLPASQQLIQITGEDGADSVFQKPDLKFAKATDHRRETLERETDMGTEMRLQEVDKKWSCLILEQISAWEIGRQVATSGQLSFAKGGLRFMMV